MDGNTSLNIYIMDVYNGCTSWIEDDCPDTFSEFIFLFPPAAALYHDFSLVDSVANKILSQILIKIAGLVW